MRHSKSAITRLKNNINIVLPDGDDIFGNKGINKASISDALQESYNILSMMENCNTTFDILCLKKDISIHCDKCNEILKGGFEFSRDVKFSKLLDILFSVRKEIKHAYLLFVENSLMTAAELGQLKENVLSMTEVLDNYRDTKSQLDENNNKIEEITESLTTLHENLLNTNPLIEETKKNIDTIYNDSQISYSLIDEYEKSISESKRSLVKNKGAYIASRTRLEKEIEKIEKQNIKSNEIISNIMTSQESINKQKDHIQEIIDDAHRASMAGSFKTRKEELDKPIKTSGIIMTCALVAIGIISFALLYASGLTKDIFNWSAFLTKLPVIAPLIWIAWANNKKHDYLMRIREDYAFKYASAMAFEGYRKQVQDTDPALELRLLQLAVENMGQNPIRLFDKKIQTTPFNELLSNASEAFEKISRSVKSSNDAS